MKDLLKFGFCVLIVILAVHWLVGGQSEIQKGPPTCYSTSEGCAP